MSTTLATVPYEHRTEVGPWFEAGNEVDGQAVYEHLAAARSDGRPYCIYVHVPYCDKLCRFCALYTFLLRDNREEVSDLYLERLVQSIAAHPWAGRGDAPTTVHFGGGTPLTIGLARLAAITEALRKEFGDSPGCEWAFETTTSSIDRKTTDGFAALGFQRIHVGIQTLDDEIRRRMGRRETAAQALAKLALLAEAGLFASVDLIIGLDGYRVATLEADLEQLWDAGVRMFSVCELRHRRPRARDGARERQESERNEACWRRLWEILDERGLGPIHLGQFARSQADNLYYTHPARGEDCAALGPYAHGSSGRLYYANHLLPDYYEAILAGKPPVAHGVVYDDGVQAIRDLERELLAHRISQSTIKALEAFHPRSPTLVGAWLEHRLLAEDDDGYSLTREGSWFVGNMVRHGRELLCGT